MAENDYEIPETDMTDELVKRFLDTLNPAERLKLARRWWRDLDPGHPHNVHVITYMVEDRAKVPLKYTMFSFELHLFEDLPEIVTLHGVTVLGLERTEGAAYIFERLHPTHVMYYFTEQDAEAMIAELTWLGNVKVQWQADIARDNILFPWYDRRGFYQAVCLHENVHIHRDTIRTTVDGVTWKPFQTAV